MYLFDKHNMIEAQKNFRWAKGLAIFIFSKTRQLIFRKQQVGGQIGWTYQGFFGKKQIKCPNFLIGIYEKKTQGIHFSERSWKYM